MKKFLTYVFACLLLLSINSVSYANHLENPGLSVDCDSFTITVSGATWDCEPIVSYELILTPLDYSSAPIKVTGTFTVPGILGPNYAVFKDETFTGEWGSLPCGEYMITGTLAMSCYDCNSCYTVNLPQITLNCECISAFDPRTPGYWKNHPESWPVASLEIGGVTYTKEQLLVMLDKPVKGDSRIILVKHLIAAKLNVISGSDSSAISGVISDADSALANSNTSKNIIITLKTKLDTFNNSNNE